jgi:hypothetical protein
MMLEDLCEFYDGNCDECELGEDCPNSSSEL